MLIPGTTESVTLRKKAGETRHFEAMVQPTKIFTEDSDLPVEEGDVVERALPNGMVETYVVEDRGFRKGLHPIPDHYQMKVRKRVPARPAPAPNAAEGADQPATHRGLSIFISHSSKDAELALALIDLLKAGLGLVASQIRCSSVDGYRLPVGVNTEGKLREEVNGARVVIGLITPSSLNSYYVMFELGARWDANLFVAPLLAGVKAGELGGPLALLNALSANNEAQLHQLLEDVSKKLELNLQPTASYLRHVSSVKALVDATGNDPTARPANTSASKQKRDLNITVSIVGEPPSQMLKLIANQVVSVSRVEYMLSSEACIASEDVSQQGETIEIPVNDASVLSLMNTPRPDRNHYDNSGPVKIGVTVSIEGQARSFILPVQMGARLMGSTMYRELVGSKTFYG